MVRTVKCACGQKELTLGINGEKIDLSKVKCPKCGKYYTVVK